MSIRQLMDYCFRLYGRRNRLFFWGTIDRVVFLNIAVGDLQDAIRKGKSKTVIGDMLGRIVSRVFCVTEAFKSLPLVEVMARKYPLSHCTYCGRLPCRCRERRPDYKLLETAASEQMEWSLREWCSGFQALYGKQNEKRDVEVLINRLFKEVVELFSVQARVETIEGSLSYIEEEIALELADVLAWTIALANFYKIDLEKCFLARYGKGCVRCGKSDECVCTSFRRGQLDWYRYVAASRIVQ